MYSGFSILLYAIESDEMKIIQPIEFTKSNQECKTKSNTFVFNSRSPLRGIFSVLDGISMAISQQFGHDLECNYLNVRRECLSYENT